MPPFGDWLVCGVSTQLRQRVAELDEVIDVSDGDFVASGLKAASLIRLGFLAVMPTAKFLGAIGSISDQRRVRLSQKAFGLSASAVSFCDTHRFFAPNSGLSRSLCCFRHFLKIRLIRPAAAGPVV